MSQIAAKMPVEIEKNLLGACLVAGGALEQAIEEGIKPEVFGYRKHQVIWECMIEMHAEGIPVADESLVSDRLARAGQLDQVGGRQYVSALPANVPAPGNARHYSAQLLDAYRLNRAHDLGHRITKLTSANGDATKLAEELREVLTETANTAVSGATATPLSAIQREQVRFLWRDRIPEGMLTLLMGDPGLGKSLLTIEIAAEITRAGGSVLMLSAEDHPAATIRPRGEAAGANLDRLHVVAMKHEDGLEDSLSLPDDAAELDRLIEETGARLVVIDPLMAHLPESVNSWRDQSMRQALGPLYRIASERGTSFLIVVHLNKATGATALYRAGGSIGIPAAVRSALLLARDPEDEDPERGTGRIIAHVKCNVGPQRESLTAAISTEQLDDDAEAARLTITGTSETKVSDLLGGPVVDEVRTKRDDAADFLREELADGPRPVTEIRDASKGAGIGWRTIEDAKAEMGIKAAKAGFSTGWTWELPEGREDEERKGHISTSAAFVDSALESDIEDREAPEGRKAAERPSTPADFDDPALATAPPCRYPDHRPSDWTGAGGKRICGVCSPKPGSEQ